MKKLVYLIGFLMAVSFSQRTWAQSVSDQNDQAIEDTLRVHLQKAQELVKQGKKEEASKILTAEHGMNQEALTNAEQLISVQPDSADNWILKGQILQGLDRQSDACTAFDNALELNPSRTDLWGMKAAALAQLGRYDESLTSMNKGIELSPNAAENFYNRACIYCLKGDKRNALDDLKIAFSMNAGFKKHALTDKDLKNLYDDKEFQELTK
ncbi:MAG: hypothetical protein Q8M08_01775 [Bacteroidales bacterium]|nr:hypothetical protein [Bacteroidales bacterium]